MLRTASRSVLIIGAVCILFATALYIDLHPYLRGGFGWRWFHEAAPGTRTAALAAAVTVYITGAWALLRWTQRGVWALVWALVGSVTLALGVVWLKQPNIGYELFIRTASMVATGPHHAAATLELDRATLINWTDFATTFDPETETVSRHVIQSPPGLPLLHEGVTGLLAQFPALARQMALPLIVYQCNNYALLAYSHAEWASAWVGMLMPLWAALTVFPVYGVARRLGAPAREAALWWALVPIGAAFAGSWNTVYPLLAITAFYVFLRGLGGEITPAQVPLPEGEGFRVRAMVAAGFLVGVLTFLNFAPIPVIGVFGFYTLLHTFAHARANEMNLAPAIQRGLRRAVVIGAWFGVGFALPWVAWMLYGGEAPWALLGASFGVHLDLERPYLPWVLLHTYDWALFAGLPLVLGSLLLLRVPNTGIRRMAWALWLSVLVLAVSGVARGETARVWSFFTPFVVIVAAALVHENRGAWTVLTVAHAAMFLALTSTWVVFGAEEMQPPPAQPQNLPSPQQLPLNANFDDEIALQSWGYARGISQTSPLPFAYYVVIEWQAQQPVTQPYWISGLFVAPDGSPVGETIVQQPQATRYPMTCWRDGERVRDVVALFVDPEQPLSPGDYWLSVAVFADEDRPEERLPVTLPDGTTDTQVGIGPITIP